MTSRTQFSWSWMMEWTKCRFEVAILTSYGRNKNSVDELKNQQKANNSLSYRFEAINKNNCDFCLITAEKK